MNNNTMKYIITENKLNKTIKGYIMEMFPTVHDVYFTTIKKSLGSTEEQPTVEETIINIIIDNSENKYQWSDLNEIAKEIVRNVDSFFSLEYEVYGSLWDFRITQLAVVKLNSYIENLKK